MNRLFIWTGNLKIIIFFIFLLIFPGFGSAAESGKKSEDGDTAKPEIVVLTDEEKAAALWKNGLDAYDADEQEKAAYNFLEYYNAYPDFENAEEGLWRAVKIYHNLALTSEKPNWERVKKLYRSFCFAFPAESQDYRKLASTIFLWDGCEYFSHE